MACLILYTIMENYTQNGGGGYAYPVQMLLRSTNDGKITGGGSQSEYRSYENLAVPIGLVLQGSPGMKSWKSNEAQEWIDDERFNNLFSAIIDKGSRSHNRSKKESAEAVKRNVTKKK
jgi:hypothetical protein